MSRLKLNIKEIRILAVVLGIWGFILLGSGISMNKSNDKIIKETYSLNVEKRKISESQAKKNEIKLKDIVLEINNPISVNVVDYLENADQISQNVLSQLVLDTSLVNINQAGSYQYSIKYNKKRYNATIVIKEKELPDVAFTLKNLEFTVGTTLSTNPRTYINETISDEVYNALSLDLSQVVPSTEGEYQYTITYKSTTYTGKIKMNAVGPKVTPPTTITPTPSTPAPSPSTSPSTTPNQ